MLLWIPSASPSQSTKHRPKYHGPYRVVKLTSPMNYAVERLEPSVDQRRRGRGIVHVDRIKSYYGSAVMLCPSIASMTLFRRGRRPAFPGRRRPAECTAHAERRRFGTASFVLVSQLLAKLLRLSLVVERLYQTLYYIINTLPHAFLGFIIFLLFFIQTKLTAPLAFLRGA